MSTKHFWLGGSIAARALACPGSLNFRGDGSGYSAAAARGTALHTCVVNLLEGKWWRAEHAVGYVEDGYRVTAKDAKSALLPAWRAAEKWLNGAPAAYEIQVKFKSIRQAGGTIDLLTETGSADFKFGSRAVEVKDNAQLQFYLAAAVERGVILPRSEYQLAIIQPAVSAKALVDTVPHRALIDMTEKLRAAVKNAKSKNPTISPGDHCTYCPRRQVCPERLSFVPAAFQAALNRHERNRNA